MEDDNDESLFDLIDAELETDVNEHITTETELGPRRANAGGVNKWLIICEMIKNLN